MVTFRNVNEKLPEFFSKYYQWFFFLALTLILALAWFNKFMQDDAFISFRYAQNFVEGKGLIFNEGENVEGYTNFLWVLLNTVPFFLSLDVVSYSQILSLIFFLGALIFSYKLSFLIFQCRNFSFLVLVFVGTNYTFSAYGTGGLETSLQVFLITWAAYLALYIISTKTYSGGYFFLFSIITSLSLLTRLDSAIPYFILYPALLIPIFSELPGKREKFKSIALLILPCLLIIGGWFLWKLSFYGDILPNTFYAKASATSIKRGIAYIALFFYVYSFFIFVLMGVFRFKEVFLFSKELRVISLISLLWFLYVMKVGGDFMEFRFMVPIVPLLCILFVQCIRVLNDKRVKMALALIPVLVSPVHAYTYHTTLNIESIRQLHEHMYLDGWPEIGKELNKLFYSKDNEVVIATTAAGAIPYYSRLTTIDMLGLNDKWIANNGIIIGTRPGHQKTAPINYFIKRNVNIVIGHPRYLDKEKFTFSDLEQFFPLKNFNRELIPDEAKVIEIPFGDKRISAIYLKKNDAIEKAIQNREIIAYDLER